MTKEINGIYLTHPSKTLVASSCLQNHPQVTFNKRLKGYRTVPLAHPYNHQSKHGRRQKFSRGAKIFALGRGTTKTSLGRGTSFKIQGMGREGEREKISFITSIFWNFLPPKTEKIKNTSNSSWFLIEQGGGSPRNFQFFSIGGVKFCPREGDCVLRGQPMGIPPPYPSPCPCVIITHSMAGRAYGRR